jgi:hypothetical protein
MFKLFTCSLLFLSFVLFSSAAVAQSSDEFNVVHVQNWKLKEQPMGDDATAFNEMLTRQSQVVNSDSRVLNFYVLRHFWGADSRDVILIGEFKNTDDLFSFYDDLESLMEKAYSKEVLDKDDALWSRYIGHHSDEIYQQSPGTGK